MGEAVRLHQEATRCFSRLGGDKGGRLVLSLFFKAILGIQRIFHFETLNDVGFAWLTGGRRVLGRNALGGLVRAASSRAVGRFVNLTRPLLDAAQQLRVSIDEHVVARFTRRFLIPKGFHTIRNKKMRAEKLFFSFAPGFRTLLDLVVTPGSARMARVAKQMLQSLRRQVSRGQLRVALDAGAAQNHKEFLDLVDDNKGHVLLVRTPGAPPTASTGSPSPRQPSPVTRSPGATPTRLPSPSSSPRPPPPCAPASTRNPGSCALSSCAR
jgi:hypothetical protein